ncbi:MAG: flippase-like domain-containing protein, partial [Rickettsiales bacterium]|nr:flippase-like domain-containing protein [Rickettsiales bacterium]
MNAKNIIKLLLKLSFAVFCIYFVIRSIDTTELVKHIKHTNLALVFAALVVLFGAQVVSALRMRYYFAHEQCLFKRYDAVAIYFVGALLNLSLPGGIGGDGYKVYIISKLRKIKKLLALKRVVSGRASGLLVLILYTGLLGFFSSLDDLIPYVDAVIAVAMIITVVCYFYSVKILLSEPPMLALGAVKYSAIVQGACVVASSLVFLSIGIDLSNTSVFIDYLVLFMISSIVSILPISLGGIGLREITFVYGALLIPS